MVRITIEVPSYSFNQFCGGHDFVVFELAHIGVTDTEFRSQTLDPYPSLDSQIAQDGTKFHAFTLAWVDMLVNPCQVLARICPNDLKRSGTDRNLWERKSLKIRTSPFVPAPVLRFWI
jgi:hypothetical protein